MADTLTPEENKRLTEELTKYANEGASDDDLRQFRDAFISELKKKGGTQPVSGQLAPQPGQPSAPSGGPSPESVDKQKTLLYNVKNAYNSFIKESEQALNDGWDVDYTTKHFSDKQSQLNSLLDELDGLGGDDVRKWTSGMRSAVDNSKQNVIGQRDSVVSWFSDPENLYEEDKGNQEWFSKNTKEIEAILSGRQANTPKEGLPSISAPKKQGIQAGVPSLREIVQKPQEEMFKPEKDDYTSQRLKLAMYQDASDNYKDIERFTQNVDLSVDENGKVTFNGSEVDYNFLIQNEDVWKKYVGEDLPWPGGVYEPSPQKRAEIKKEAERRIKQKVESANSMVEEALDTKIIDKIVQENFNGKTYAHFIKQPDETITQPTADSNKVSEQVQKIIEHYGLDPKGTAAIALYDKAMAAVQSESDNYRIEEKFKEESPEEYALREKYKSGKFEEEINAKFLSELESTFSLYETQANDEVSSIVGAAKKKADDLARQYNGQVEELKQQAKDLGELYQSGQMDELSYQDALGKLNQELSSLSDAFKALMPKEDELMKEANKVYSRYNTAFETRKAAIMKMADEELRSVASIPAADMERINKAYQAAYDKAYKEKNNELYTEIKRAGQASAVPFYQMRRSLMNGVGNWISDMGSYTDSYATKVFGDNMKNKWSSSTPDIEEMGLNTELYYQTQNILGNMLGFMTPALATTAAVSVATRGAAAPEAAQFMSGWLTNWASETMARAGANGRAEYDKSGDVRLEQQAINRTIDSQQDMFLTYALDGLGFTGAGYRAVSGFTKGVGAGIRGRLARGGVGATFEVVTETFTQEIPQAISDENILENRRDPWTDFGEMYSGARISETLKGVAPVGVLGFIGGVRTGSLAQQRADKAMAFDKKATLYGGFEDQRRQYLQGLVFDKDEKYARAVVSAMYATGAIKQVEAEEMQKQITEAGRLKETADKQGLNRAQRNVYSFFAARAEEARRNADKNNQDPILMKMYRQQQSDYERMGADYLQGKSTDLLTLTYTDGTTMMMTPEDAKNLSENKNFLDALSRKQVSVTGYGNTKGLLDDMQQKVNDHKTSSAWKATAKALTESFKGIIKPGRVEIEDKKPSAQAIKTQQDKDVEVYNNTNDMKEAVKNADNFMTTVIGNPLWSSLTDQARNSIKSIAGQMRADRQLLESSDPDSNEHKQARERISANERAVYDILNTKQDDTQDIEGVSGQVREGQKPVETQPVPTEGEGETQTGGVLQEEEVSGDPKERVLNSITEQDYIDNAPAITTSDVERIKSDDAAKKQAAERARKEAESAYAYLDGSKTAKEFLADNGYDVEGMSDEEAKRFADSDAEYWKNKLSAEEAKGGKKPSKGKKPARSTGAQVAQKEQEAIELLERGVQASQERIKQLIAEGATPDQAYAITEEEWKQTEDGKRYMALQEEVNKASQEQTPTPSRKKKKQEAPKMPEMPTTGQQRIATINALEQMIYDSETGKSPMSLEETSEVKTRLAEMKKQNKEGGLTEVEALIKKALGEKVVTMRDIDNMVKDNKVEVKCPPGKKKAEDGMRMGFIPGGKWDIVTEFKGKSHENGGIDIEITGGKINYTSKEPNLKAKRGGFWNALKKVGTGIKDVGLTIADTTLSTVGNVAGIKSMQDIIDEDQYSNDKFDEAGNFVGKLAGTALKVIPVTAPIASAVGMAGGAINQIAGIDAKNYDPSQHTSKLSQAGDIISAAGTIAGMAVNAGTAASASKTFAAGDKLSAAQKMSMQMGGINRTLGQVSKGVGMIGGGVPQQQPQQFLQQTQSNPALLPQQTMANPYQQPQYGIPAQQTYSNNRGNVVTINGVNYAPDQYGNLVPVN
jgi:hypothetical protein